MNGLEGELSDERDLLISAEDGAKIVGLGNKFGSSKANGSNAIARAPSALSPPTLTRTSERPPREQTARVFAKIIDYLGLGDVQKQDLIIGRSKIDYRFLDANHGTQLRNNLHHVTISADDDQMPPESKLKDGLSSRLRWHQDDDDEDQDRRHHLIFSRRRQRLRLFTSLLLSILLLGVSLILLAKLVNLVQEYRIYSEQQLVLSLEELIDRHELELGKNSRWLVANSKCHIPNLEPWPPSISNEAEVKPSLNCKEMYKSHDSRHHTKEALTFVRDNKLYFSTEATQAGALTNEQCCYKEVTRGFDDDEDLVYGETCTPITEQGINMSDDVIQVQCSNYNYTNVHSFIVHRSEEEEALARVGEKKLLKDQYYNLVLLGVDTMSRLNGLRQLNKTLTLLKGNSFKALDFVGYNKVGENTFPNLIPLLTGMTPEQLTETRCWLATNYSQESESGDDYLDNCKYLWNYYQQLGYVTYMSEDWPKASTFNYLKKGFKVEPTTYYGRPFQVARQPQLLPPVNMGCQSCQLDEPIVQVDLNRLKSFLMEHHDKPYFAFQWINCPQHDDLNGGSQVDEILAQFLMDIKGLIDQRTMFVFFSDHGYRWNPFVSTRQGHYEASLPLMTWSAPQHFLKHHPDLWTNMKAHQQALLTPFDMFKSLIDLRNLGANREAPEDMSKPNKSKGDDWENKHDDSEVSTNLPPHRIDYLALTAVPTAATTIRQLEPITGLTYRQNFRTISLLEPHTRSQLDRSCQEAGIPDNYCVCHELEPTNVDSFAVRGAAQYLVYVHLYKQLWDARHLCHLLDLDKITKAELFDYKRMRSTIGDKSGRRRRRKISTTPPSNEDDDGTHQDDLDEHNDLPKREYNIRFATKPGGALFQEVVRFYGRNMDACEKEIARTSNIIDGLSNHSFEKKHKLVVAMNKVCRFSVHSQSISRLNLYKDQSKCVKNNIELKKICLCHSKDSNYIEEQTITTNRP